jgi:hypothetical protein
MFAANSDAIAMNTADVEITPGCAPAIIEDENQSMNDTR